MTKIKFIEPHSREWYDARLGCFTASQAVRLLKGGTRKMTDQELENREKGDKRTTVDTLFGEGALTYINEKVAEIINKKPKETPVTKPMQWGLAHEEDALDLYCRITGIKMIRSGFFKYGNHRGGTPDGHKGSRKIVGIVEIKCLNSENHSEISEFTTVEQLRKFDESFFVQSQMNMKATGARWCDFISYDPRPMGYNDDGEVSEEDYDPDKFIFCIKIIRIKRDEAFIENLEYRLDQAELIMAKKIEKRMRTADYNLRRYNRTQLKVA